MEVNGVLFVDVNAGYHEGHTQWRWAAGAGLDQQGRLVAFNAINGLFDTPTNSERTIWINDVAQEVGPNTFSADLSTVSFAERGTLTFQPEQLIEQHGLMLRELIYGTWSGRKDGLSYQDLLLIQKN